MDQVADFLDRPRRYFNIDGMGELGAGVVSVGSALLLCLLARLPASSAWHQISLLLFLGLALVTHNGIKIIKNRVTYCRTGFVEYRSKGHQPIIGVLGALVPFGLWAAEMQHTDITAAALLAGLLFAGAYAYAFAGAVRWKWAVVLAIAFGAVRISLLPLSVLAELANDSVVTHPLRAELLGALLASLFTYGAMLLISGGITFWLYLRSTHTLEQEHE